MYDRRFETATYCRNAASFAAPCRSASRLTALMELAIQPCVPCAELHGQASTAEPHRDLSLSGVAEANGTRTEEHYLCSRCAGAFARILDGKPARQVWMLVNAGQH